MIISQWFISIFYINCSCDFMSTLWGSGVMSCHTCTCICTPFALYLQSGLLHMVINWSLLMICIRWIYTLSTLEPYVLNEECFVVIFCVLFYRNSCLIFNQIWKQSHFLRSHSVNIIFCHVKDQLSIMSTLLLYFPHVPIILKCKR